MKHLKHANLEQAVSSVVAALVAMALTGCPGPVSTPEGDAAAHADHDHGDGHEHATTLVGAYEELEHMAADIKSSFQADKPGDAHDAMHEIGHVILSIPALAEKAGVGSADEVKQVTDDLMDGFAKLDDVMHGGDKVTWDDVSAKIDAAMQKLEGWLPADAHADHDHDGDDHADHQH
ncbi:hypothetical protein Pla123a_40190 [Posidoniimonas polymericola]|uniref:Uncharacterized protein n=1 Tax=Posidoniimonas polymericola TaxID=2528002 RepID=A0A5C5YBG0_9BACT|nr:hypothetical protein [Posidoniimonas polymericola]TWT72720.1 hypothetical protein Pla123a_40190 [Posidoniimonas polymericola]